VEKQFVAHAKCLGGKIFKPQKKKNKNKNNSRSKSFKFKTAEITGYTVYFLQLSKLFPYLMYEYYFPLDKKKYKY
jgi:hypothetical protein